MILFVILYAFLWVEYFLFTHWRCYCFGIFFKMSDSFTIFDLLFDFMFLCFDPLRSDWSPSSSGWSPLTHILRFEIEKCLYLEILPLGKEEGGRETIWDTRDESMNHLPRAQAGGVEAGGLSVPRPDVTTGFYLTWGLLVQRFRAGGCGEEKSG